MILYLSMIKMFWEKDGIKSIWIWKNRRNQAKAIKAKDFTEHVKMICKKFDPKLNLTFPLLRRVVIAAYDQKLYQLNVDYKKIMNTSVLMIRVFYLRMLNDR